MTMILSVANKWLRHLVNTGVSSEKNGQWGSFGNHAQENNNPIQFKAIFEFDTKPECVVGGQKASL